MTARMLIFALLLLAAPAMAQKTAEQADQNAGPAAQYAACMNLAKTAPEKAFEQAMSWRDMGGGAAAKHCVAASLMGLGNFNEAAKRFENLAREIKEKPLFRAELLGQASQAWLMDANPGRAEAAATAALKLNPQSHTLLVDRATARAALADYKKALKDLNLAIEANPQSADAFVFRASTQRFLKNLKAADLDANHALIIDPLHPEGLLERGIIRRLKGDDNGARADWLKILKALPDAPAAKAAQTNLEMMDVKGK